MAKENVYFAKEKMDIFLNIEEGDKEKFENLICFCSRAMELTVKERTTRVSPEEGDIWTCDFGYNVGSEIDKVRPCVIRTAPRGSKCVTISPISHTENIQPTHVKLDDSVLAFKADNVDGVIKVEIPRSVSKARLGKKIGKLNEEGMKQVKLATCLHENIGPEILELLLERQKQNK